MPALSVPWGAGNLPINLPAEWVLQQLATPQLQTAPSDWPDRMATALGQPCAGLPLQKLLAARRNGRIALVVEDLTRHSPLPQILEIVLREIRHAGIDNDQMEIFFATGMHPPLTDEQAAEKLGPAADGIAWRCNPWKDASEYASVGRSGKLDADIFRPLVEADLRIVISSVSPHLQAGFGGGYKMFTPGLASLDTIRSLHRLGLDDPSCPLVGTDVDSNPMRTAIDDVGRRIDEHHGKTFAVQYILDNDDLPAVIATGEMIPAQRMLAKKCAVASGILVDPPADVLITNAYPRDFDLWQSFKCIANTRWAARPNGVIICLTRCEAGANGIKPPPWPVSNRWTRKIVRWLGPEMIASLVTRLIPSLAGDAAFFVRMAVQACHRNPIFLVSPTLHAEGIRFPGLWLFAELDEAFAAAKTMLDERQQRVVVFPSGGASYPILTPGRNGKSVSSEITGTGG